MKTTVSTALVESLDTVLGSILLSVALGPVHVTAEQFVQVTSPGWTNSSQFSFTGAWGDYDNDGFIDLFVANTTAEGSP